MNNAYDIIGDVHGQADALVALLRQLDYEERGEVWRHNERSVIFVGDFIDRGPKQVESIMIVRRMIDAGVALAVMGNHDFNAVAWYLPDPSNPGDHLRSHFSNEYGAKNRRQHAEFLREVERHPSLHEEIIDWVLTLPLWLDLPGLRIVHACLHSRFIEYLTARLLPGALLSVDLMQAATCEPAGADEKDTPEPTLFKAVDMILKGMEVPLPLGSSFRDKDGIERTRARVRWWDDDATTYRKAALLESRMHDQLPELPIPSHLLRSHATDKPIFFGHYSLKGAPDLLSERIAGFVNLTWPLSMA